MPDGVTVAVTGAITSGIAAILAFVGTNRARRSDHEIALIEQMREFADDLREQERACRTELAEVRHEVDALRDQIRELRRIIDAHHEGGET